MITKLSLLTALALTLVAANAIAAGATAVAGCCPLCK